MRPDSAARVRGLLGPESLEQASLWADEYRRNHPETGPWHYINIPLTDTHIDLARECPNRGCVVLKVKDFLAVLGNPIRDRTAKVEALKFVVHFIGDLLQPLHDEDNGDKGRNLRQVIFDP